MKSLFFAASGKTGIFHSHTGLTFIYSLYHSGSVNGPHHEWLWMYHLFSNCTECNSLLFYSLYSVNHCLHQWKPGQVSKHLRWNHYHQNNHPSCFPPSDVHSHSWCLLPLSSSIASLQCHHCFHLSIHTQKHIFIHWLPHAAAGTKLDLIINSFFYVLWIHSNNMLLEWPIN